MLPLAAPLLQTSLRDCPPDRQGKVRDLYDLGDYLLTQISAFWFHRTRSIGPNHVSTVPAAFRRIGASGGRLAARPQAAPVPSLPDDVVAKTREQFVEAFHRLTGRELQ